MTERLSVEGLRVRLGSGGADIVDDVSFTVRPGEVLGLVGESGSGKTTVAMALLGHARSGLRIDGGSVRLEGTDILTLGRSRLRAVRGAKVAYVPQDPSAALNPALRVGTQLKEALTSHPGTVDDPDARVAQVLAEVRLDPASGILRRYPHQLSGGQQQRVAIAMAFACRPSVIVLDEPTTGLDVSTQRHVLDTVRSLCEEYGVAAVYVSHDLAVVRDLVSQVAVLYAGRVIELGRTEEVFPSPLHPYTRALLSAVPSPERSEVLNGIPGQPPRPGHRPPGCSFAPRCGYARPECRADVPPPTQVSGRLVRCLRAEAIADDPPPARVPLTAAPEIKADAALSVRGLAAAYGGNPVLRDVSLDVTPRSCTAVVGESGSGKTTLARCVVGLHDGWKGDIQFQGSPLGRGIRPRSRQLLKEIQYIFQNPYTSLNPRKTIRDIVGQPLDHFFDIPASDKERKVRQVLDEVSLGDSVLDRFPDQLSGGERQRVAIARAVVVEPRLLVCDEVTSALDVSVQAVVVELLRKLQRERDLALLFITHNLALVRSIAQDVVVLNGGVIVEAGPVDKVLGHPSDPYTISLMNDIPKA